MFDENAMYRLKKYRRMLTHQEYQTLKGQILSHNSLGAMKGLDSILQRRMERGVK